MLCTWNMDGSGIYKTLCRQNTAQHCTTLNCTMLARHRDLFVCALYHTSYCRKFNSLYIYIVRHIYITSIYFNYKSHSVFNKVFNKSLRLVTFVYTFEFLLHISFTLHFSYFQNPFSTINKHGIFINTN